jgi:hypothetical protein
MMMNATSVDFIFIFWQEILHYCKILELLVANSMIV